MKLKLLLIAIIPLTFFLISLLTLKDYGISWDEPIHFYRGQAYLHYFLTGKTRFDVDRQGSYFQSNQLSAEYFLIRDDGHPPLNGILASLSNFIFYQKLGIMGDIESYHLFNMIVSTLLVAIVVFFAFSVYGVFAAIIAGLVITTYPLFFAESHFNIKDPAETAFFTLTIWAFWKSLQKGSWRWLLLSAVSAGLALGTKFNILFLPLIILPYLAFRYGRYFAGGWYYLLNGVQQVPKLYLFALFTSPFIIFSIFFISWPFLWQDPVENIPKSLLWYQDIGTGRATFGYFLPSGLNLYAPVWILVTTPPWVIILLAIGIWAVWKRRRDMNYTPILWLLWFIVPIARVVAPNTTIYGGVRQIMEFLPAMALISGLGAHYIILNLKLQITNHKQIQNFRQSRGSPLAAKLKNWSLEFICILVLGIWSLITIIRLHPNENVYFNSIIGGLAGAKDKNVPYWGNSFGNAYWQAVQWLNKNAPLNSKIALIQGTTLNIPKIQLREDLRFSNSFWSGIYRDGEYLVELTHQDKRVYPYAWEYVETFLIPVYEVKVNNVAIAKIWKNDLANTKEDFKRKEIIFDKVPAKLVQGQEIVLDLGKSVILSRIVALYSKENCQGIEASVSTSKSGADWQYEEDSIPANQLVYREKEALIFTSFYFPGRSVRFIKLVASEDNSCLLSPTTGFKVYMLKDLP